MKEIHLKLSDTTVDRVNRIVAKSGESNRASLIASALEFLEIGLNAHKVITEDCKGNQKIISFTFQE